MPTVQQRDKRVEKAQTGVIFKVPFFAPGVAKLPVVWDESIPTACTAGINIRFNPGFFDSLTDSQVVTVLCHETWHCLAGHVWRAPDGVNWEQWNIAADHETNLMLKEFSAVTMAKGLADPFPFPDPADAYCADPQFVGMAVEPIYGKLANRSRMPQDGCGGVQTPAGASQGQQPGKGKQGGGKPGPGSMPSFGQIEAPKPGQQSTNKALASDWSGTLIQSAKLAAGQGTLPAGMQRLVEGLINPRVPWQEILRSWLREQCADDWNFLEPALEYEDSGFMLPSLRSERMAPVVFGWDRSGSIDDKLDAMMVSEAQGCLDNLRPRKLVVMPFDTRVTAVREYVPGDTIDTRSTGGGGTDFRDLFQKCDEMHETPRCVVVLTDLAGTFPEREPSYPVLWVCWDKGATAPFGLVVEASRSAIGEGK